MMYGAGSTMLDAGIFGHNIFCHNSLVHNQFHILPATQSALYMKIVGPENLGEKRKTTLAVMTSRFGFTWFVKLIGPAAEVTAQQKAFEDFAASIRFRSTNAESEKD